VHVDTNEFVFVAVVLYRLNEIFVNLYHVFRLSLFISRGFFLLRQTAFLAHDIIVTVGLKVQDSWELKHSVDLVVPKRIKVEYDALQVNN
jgi:hypothetical protein